MYDLVFLSTHMPEYCVSVLICASITNHIAYSTMNLEQWLVCHMLLSKEFCFLYC